MAIIHIFLSIYLPSSFADLFTCFGSQLFAWVGFIFKTRFRCLWIRSLHRNADTIFDKVKRVVRIVTFELIIFPFFFAFCIATYQNERSFAGYSLCWRRDIDCEFWRKKKSITTFSILMKWQWFSTLIVYDNSVAE